MSADTSVNVRVVVRCRPMNSKEKAADCQKIVKISEKDGTVELMKPADVVADDNLPKSYVLDPCVCIHREFSSTPLSMLTMFLLGYLL